MVRVGLRAGGACDSAPQGSDATFLPSWMPLYLSYDGALDPLGRSQVVPYLEGLSGRGWRFDLVTFEKGERWRESG